MKRKLALLLIAALIIIPFTSAFALNSMEEQVRDYLEKMTNDFRWNKEAFGYETTKLGELVFSTGMGGYTE